MYSSRCRNYCMPKINAQLPCKDRASKRVWSEREKQKERDADKEREREGVGERAQEASAVKQLVIFARVYLLVVCVRVCE